MRSILTLCLWPVVAVPLLLAGCVQSPPVYVQEPGDVVVRERPPAVREEFVPAPPGVGYAWHQGYWRWRGGGWAWEPGHYVERPHPSAYWIPGHWAERRYGSAWVPGHWG